jgi:hypothetical protein
MPQYQDNQASPMETGQAYHQPPLMLSGNERNIIPYPRYNPEYSQSFPTSHPGISGHMSDERHSGNCLGPANCAPGLLQHGNLSNPSLQNMARMQDQYNNSDPFLIANPNHGPRAPQNTLSITQANHSERLEVLSATCESLAKQVNDLREANLAINTRLDELEDTVKDAQTHQSKTSKPNSKNISNQHREVKVSWQFSHYICP